MYGVEMNKYIKKDIYKKEIKMNIREEGRQKEKKFKEKARDVVAWLSGLIALTILLVVFVNVFIAGNRDKGLEESRNLISGIEVISDLPWGSDDHKIIAVIECNNEEIFVKYNQSVGEEAMGCIIHIVKDVKIIESFYRFQPKARLEFIITE